MSYELWTPGWVVSGVDGGSDGSGVGNSLGEHARGGFVCPCSQGVGQTAIDGTY